MQAVSIIVTEGESSVKRRRIRAKNRDREEGHKHLIQDYFAENCV